MENKNNNFYSHPNFKQQQNIDTNTNSQQKSQTNSNLKQNNKKENNNKNNNQNKIVNPHSNYKFFTVYYNLDNKPFEKKQRKRHKNKKPIVTTTSA